MHTKATQQHQLQTLLPLSASLPIGRLFTLTAASCFAYSVRDRLLLLPKAVPVTSRTVSPAS